MPLTTVGKTTGGSATTTSSADKMVASRFLAGSGGTLTGGHLRAWLSAAGSTTVKLVVYADSSGSPGARLATSDQVTLSATAEGVLDFVFTGGAQIALTAATYYWLAATWDDPGTPSVTYSRDETSGQRLERGDITYGTPPDPFGTPTGTFSGPVDIWVDLDGTTTGGGSTTLPTVRNVQTAGKSSTASASISVTKPTGLAVGDYLLAISVGDADITLASMTAPSGWTTLSSQAGSAADNYPSMKIFGKAATSTETAASSFSFGFTSSGDGCTILAAITTGTYDTSTPVAVGSYTATPRTATTLQTAPSMTGVDDGLAIWIFGTDTNNTTESYPTSPTTPSGTTRLATVQGTPHYAMAGGYYKALTAAGATGTATVSPTGAGSTNGWTSTVVMVNPATSGGSGGSGGDGTGTEGYTLLASVNHPTTTYLDTSIVQASGQTLGVGGIPAPAPGAGVVLVTADSSSVLSISTGNRVYDGQNHSVPRINITADNVTVQNFRITGGGQYGVEIRANNVTVQNCDFKGLLPTGDGDMNAISFFGNGFKMLYNTIGVSGFLVGTTSVGGSHTDAVQTWNNDPGESSSNVVIQGNHIKGPGTGDARFIHQGVMAEGKSSTSGGGGGTGSSTGWLILDNKFEMSAVNQIIKLDDIDDVDIARNEFIGSASSVFDIRSTSNPVRIWSSNIWTAFTGTKPSTTAGDGPDGPARPGSGSSGEPVAYSYVVTAVDAAGNESGGGPPGGGTGGPPDTVAPTVPTNLAGEAGDRRVGLTWDPATDASSGVGKYRLYRGGVLLAEPVATNYVDIDVVNGTQYSYTVAAVDRAGNASAQSAAVLVTPVVVAIGGVPLLPGRVPGGKVEVCVAWGADLAADEATWAWSDITPDVRFDPGISTSLGRDDESSTSNPAELSLVLDNSSGDYSLGTGSARYPYVRRNTPIRVRIDPGTGGARVVVMAFANGWTPGWDSLKGNLPVVTLSASGTLRRLAQGSAPVQSAYRRVMTALSSVKAYWPLEEGKSSAFAPAVRGGTNFTHPGTSPFTPPTSSIPNWESNTDFDCSAALPTLGDAYLQANVNSYTNTGTSQVRFLLSIPDSGLADGTVLMHISMTGTIHRWDLTYGINAEGAESLGLYRYNASDGSRHSFDIIGFGNLNGTPSRVSLDWQQSGANIVWTLSVTPARPGAVASFFRQTLAGRTAGIVSHFEVNPHSAQISAAIGHITVENAITSFFSDFDVLVAHHGETATATNGRLARLCAENGTKIRSYGSGATLGELDKMGPQLVAPLLDLLRECEVSDQGQLWDGRNAGLQYTTRRRRGLGTVKLVVDASAGQLAGEFRPVDDDQRDRNKAVVTRLHGITVTHEDVTGPKGTSKIGIYDDAITVNTAWDDSVQDFAEWFVRLGTQEGYRYPSVTVDLAASPELAAAVLDIIPGERINITNLNTTLAEFPDATVSLIVEGIAHEITPRTWSVTFRCTSYTPWATGLGG